MKNKLILVGGFLGAGKTTLLFKTALQIRAQGGTVGLITNDQAADLVDTDLLRSGGFPVEEVSGSCFCCNFPGFIRAVQTIAAEIPNGIILAEPVGSCTDLSATILQPLKERYGNEVVTAPFTVLGDPARITELLNRGVMEDNYIAAKQFEEADLILINKTDLLSDAERTALVERAEKQWPQAKIMTASAKDETGIPEWLDDVLHTEKSGTHLVKVDYDIYAAGEAAYGWVNAKEKFRKSSPKLPLMAQSYLDALAAAFRQKGIAVGHVKFMLQMKEQNIVGNLTGPDYRKDLHVFSGAGSEAGLIINARAKTDPDTLRAMVLWEAEKIFAECGPVLAEEKSLIPGRPNPTYRYTNVV